MVDVNEFSFIVPRRNNQMSNKEFVKFAVSLAKKYDQNSVLIAGIPEISNGQIRYLKPDELLEKVFSYGDKWSNAVSSLSVDQYNKLFIKSGVVK